VKSICSTKENPYSKNKSIGKTQRLQKNVAGKLKCTKQKATEKEYKAVYNTYTVWDGGVGRNAPSLR
jgi:predicted ribonuclease toxin of YeeF-YezG toxin-antitoxin module